MADTSPIRDANFWREEFLGLCELAEELRRNGQVDPDDDSEDPGDPQEEVLAADLEPGKPSSSALKKVSAVVPIHALRTTTCTIAQFLKEAVIRLHRIPTYECACCERIFHSSSRLVNHLEIYHADAMEVESDIDNSITITAIPDVEIVEKTSAIIKLIPEESVNTSVTTVVQGATDSNTQGIVTTDEEMITNISSPASLIPYRYSPTCLESETLSSPAVAEDINDLPIPCTGTGNCQLSSTTNPTDLIVQTSKEPVVENMSVLVLPKPVVPEIPVSEDLQQWTPKEPECLEQRIQDSHNGNIPPLILPQQAATHSPTLMLSSLHVHHSPTTLVQISPSQAEHNQALLLPIQPVQHLPALLLTSPPVSNVQPLLLLPALPVHEEPICTVTTSHSNLNPAHSVEQTPILPDEIAIATNRNANNSTSNSNTSDFSDLIALPTQPLHESLPLPVVQQRSEERYNFACSWCKSVFKSLNQLKSHRNSSHSLELERNRVQKFEVKEHKCGLCDEVFKTASAMLQHISVHTPALSANIYIQCMLCQKLFLTPQGLDQHQRKIHPNHTADQTTGGASAPHIVLDAGQQSDKPGTPDIMSSAASHLNNILSNYPAEVACSFYTIGARVEDSIMADSNTNNLNLNNVESPSADPAPDPDPPCVNIDGAETEEPPRKKRRQCMLCPDVFLSRVDLCEHLEQSHFIDAIPVECKICKCKFDSCTVFKRHAITHKDKTSECSSSATRKNDESGLTKQSHPSELERLLILSRTPTTELELKCDHCPAVYSDLFNMKIHCKLYHSNMNTDSTAAATSREASSTSDSNSNPEQEILRPKQSVQQLLVPQFEVPSLQTQSSILNNLLSSPVSKPDPCEICGLEFQFRHQLVEHVYQLHRDTRVCCGIIFTSQSGLSVHQSRHALRSLSTTEISSTANTGGVLLQQQVLAAEGVRHLPALIKILPKSSKATDTPSLETPNPSPSTTVGVDQQPLVAVSPAVLEAYVQASLVKKKGKQGNQQNRNHKCLLCNKYFTRTGLVSHLGRVHFQAERRDKFECTTGACKLRFSTSQELVQHEQYHVEQNTTETVKGYPCACCPIIFKQQWQKKAHENIYHKNKTASVVSSNSKPAHGNETIINIEVVGGSLSVSRGQEHGEQLQQGLNQGSKIS